VTAVLAVWTMPAGAQAVSSGASRDLLKAWDTHPVVAVSEAEHRAVQDKDFLLSLITSPEFATKVNDIVVEFGTALMQPLLDRYMEGEDIPLRQLRRVWADTTVVNGLWDAPVYRNFFAAVRAHNQTLPKHRRLRVLACDPPIDRARVSTLEAAAPFLARDPFCASLVEREVLAKGRKALAIMGDAHLIRRHLTGKPVTNTVTLIEAKHPGAVFVVLTHRGQYRDSATIEQRLGAEPVPSLAPLRGTWLGSLPAMLPKPLTRTRVGGPTPTTETIVVTEPPLFQDVADALLYLGPKGLFTRSVPGPEQLSQEDLRELERRHLLIFKTPLDHKLVFQ
jgi:hypothetical protein